MIKPADLPKPGDIIRAKEAKACRAEVLRVTDFQVFFKMISSVHRDVMSEESCIEWDQEHRWEIEPKDEAPAGKNVMNPPKEVLLRDLERENPGQFKRKCPECKEGTLTLQRDPNTVEILRFDRCILCGQAFIFIDEVLEENKNE